MHWDISRLECGASNFTIEFKRGLIRYMSLLLVLGLRSIRCVCKGLFADRCLTFQMFVASCPSSFRACLMSFTSVEA
jgi:hypothetical protein